MLEMKALKSRLLPRLETPEQEQALLAENLDQPPEADLVQTVVSDCTSIEMTEPQTSQYRSASDMSDPSWRGAASVSFILWSPNP